jgi:hypothetical protein
MLPGELSLDDMLAEPIVKLLMDRDGVDEAELRSLMRSTPSSLIAAPRADCLSETLVPSRWAKFPAPAAPTS